MVCRVIGIVLGLGAVVLTLWSLGQLYSLCTLFKETLGTTKWSVSVPMTASGQPITFEAYRGLWKQCYGSGQAGFNVSSRLHKTPQTKTFRHNATSTHRQSLNLPRLV